MSGKQPGIDPRFLGPMWAEVMGLPPPRPSGAEWDAIVVKYRGWLARPGNGDKRPTQAEIAAELGIVERTLVRRLRECGVEDWHDVAALVVTEL